MDDTSYTWAPLLRLAFLGLLVAAGPLLWWALRHRGVGAAQRMRALTGLTLFLTFDLILFGAFTRLTDSGLGCPDWPGCYGSASPVGAREHISAAQAAMPTGPVTFSKAWIEMIHRYLAMSVGVLILVLCALTWRQVLQQKRSGQAANGQALPLSPWWATATLVWVCVQGAFGALTVTMKLFPAIVTLHLLGGLLLLILLAVQSQAYTPKPLVVSKGLRIGAWLTLVLSVVQIALGGWVSTNYAVLACTDFPTCQGQWWPAVDFAEGFTLWRELGMAGTGEWLSFAALTAIHLAHRLGALVVLTVLLLLAWRLMARGDTTLRRWGIRLLAVAAWQLLTGLSNVVLDWPVLAAVAHTGGAAVLLLFLSVMLTRIHQGRTVGAHPRSNRVVDPTPALGPDLNSLP